ncbi:Peptidase C19 ubiquitin carboxyl-terminal hydrolase [Trinorchestia longiramus]|nr:Peptidase C19 ubiquitin carboxyl-terminal hydrolase [Trinorchestia longiramus]
MPASSAEGISGIAAALETNFKQQQHRLKDEGNNQALSTNSESNSHEDGTSDSWVDQILGNDLFTKRVEYVNQKETVFNGRLGSAKLMHLKKEDMSVACKNGGTSDMAAPKSCAKMNGTSGKVEDELEEPRVVLYKKEKVKLGWVHPPTHRAGMSNLGNTCYLNSSLQALFHIPAFGNWLLEESESHLHQCSQNGMNASFCSLCAMIKTLRLSRQPSQNVIRPHLIASKLKCIGKMLILGRQEDAHEFIKLLLDHMERSYLIYRRATKLDHLSRQTTPLNQIFGGYLRQQVSCPACHYVSTTFSHFQDLVLDIRTSSSLDQALEYYFRKETLDAANCYKCERCKKKVPATKRSLIERPPNVLLIQLKRFTFNGCKIGKHINIQRYLDLSRFVNGCHVKGKSSSSSSNGCAVNGSEGVSAGGEKQPYTYRLVSMVVHLGGSQHGGHYIACAEGANRTMYEFDDCSVRAVGVQSVLLRNPYILFYELVKRSPDPCRGKEFSLVRSASDKMDVSSSSNFFPALNRSSSVGKMAAAAKSTPLNNGSVDLGEVVVRPKPAQPSPTAGLPPPKQRERITFDLKSSAKCTAPTTSSRPKMIIRTNVPLLNSPKVISQTAVAASLSSAKISSGSASKLSSTGYLLSVQKKSLASNTGNAVVNGSLKSTSLVPYVDDSDASDTESGDSRFRLSNFDGNAEAAGKPDSPSSSTDTKTACPTISSGVIQRCQQAPVASVDGGVRSSPTDHVQGNSNSCDSSVSVDINKSSGSTSIEDRRKSKGDLQELEVKCKTEVPQVTSSSTASHKTSDGWLVSDSSDDSSNASQSSASSRSDRTKFVVTEKSKQVSKEQKKKKKEMSVSNGWKVTKRKEDRVSSSTNSNSHVNSNIKEECDSTDHVSDKSGKSVKGLLSYIPCLSGVQTSTESSPYNDHRSNGNAEKTLVDDSEPTVVSKKSVPSQSSFKSLVKNSLCNGNGRAFQSSLPDPSDKRNGVHVESSSKQNGNFKSNIEEVNSFADTNGHGDSADVQLETCLQKEAPPTSKLAWDRHSKGNLAYSLSSHKNKTSVNDEQQNGVPRQFSNVIWNINGERMIESDRTLHTLQSSSSLVFGTKVSTWEGGDSELDAQQCRDVHTALRKTEDERYDEDIDAARQKKRKNYHDQQEAHQKKLRFDSYVRNGSDKCSSDPAGPSNPNLVTLGDGKNSVNRGWSGGGGGGGGGQYGRNKHRHGGFVSGRGNGGGGGRGYRGGGWGSGGRGSYNGDRRGGGGRPWRGGGGKQRWNGAGVFNHRR